MPPFSTPRIATHFRSSRGNSHASLDVRDHGCERHNLEHKCWCCVCGTDRSTARCSTRAVAAQVATGGGAINSTTGPGASYCGGIDIVQSDHAPEAGVAQGIFDGELVRHQGGHQEELEEEPEEEVERRVRRDHSRHQTQVRMHG